MLKRCLQYQQIENDDIMEQLRIKDYEKGDGFTLKKGPQNDHQATTFSNQVLDVYNFLQLNTTVEWGYAEDINGKKYIGTRHRNDITYVTGLDIDWNNITKMIHSHPRKGEDSSEVATKGDMDTANAHPQATHYMVSHRTGTIVRFSGNSACIKRVPINKNNLRYVF